LVEKRNENLIECPRHDLLVGVETHGRLSLRLEDGIDPNGVKYLQKTMVSIQYDPEGVAFYGVLCIAINMQSLRGIVAGTAHGKAVKNGKFNTLKGFEATLNDAETDIWYSSGTYGIVFRLRHKREKKLYALKVLKESTPELLEPCEAPSEAKPVRWRPRRARPSY
jgi:hypothetical protein